MKLAMKNEKGLILVREKMHWYQPYFEYFDKQIWTKLNEKNKANHIMCDRFPDLIMEKIKIIFGMFLYLKEKKKDPDCRNWS